MKASQKQIIKKNNARIQKWRTMLSTGLHKDPILLKSRTRKGIPPGIRMLAWPQLVNLNKTIEVSKYNYQKLTNSFSNNIYQIALDIPRTFPEQEDSILLRKSMNNVLKAISIVHPKIGYCQGMNFLALRTLQILNDQTTFWILHHQLQNDSDLQSHLADPRTTDKDNYVFQQLLQQKLPKVYKAFQQNKVMIQAFSVKWFMTLFSNVLSQQLFNRLFQVYLLQGRSIIYAVGLALFKNKQKQIQKNTFQQTLYMMNAELYKIDDIDIFMNMAYQMNITNKKIEILTQKYYNTKTKTQNSQNRRSLQVKNRQQSNRQEKKYIPNDQQIQNLQFQNKSAQLNFQQLQMLKDYPIKIGNHAKYSVEVIDRNNQSGFIKKPN